MASPQSGPGREDTSATVASRLIHDGRVVHLSVDRVRFPDGSEGDLELIRHPGASAVLPVVGSPDDDDPKVLLVRQYRYAGGGYIYEVPAGLPQTGETWEQCASRELEEEAGVVAGRLEYLTRIHTTPGFTNEVIHLFAGFELSSGTVDRDEDEFLAVEEHRLSTVLEMVADGRITDGKSVVTILFAARFLLGRGNATSR
ncbi:MAG: NUDIX hydrolase [Gemmatimonadetes bacterium]|nr:NUDIX hydrolase [Gemmatimonadota bacterium]